MIDVDLDEEMEMPCPCDKCGEWFDLLDGVSSKKWYPNTVICDSCGAEERAEIEKDEEVEDLKNMLSDAFCTVRGAIYSLKKLGVNVDKEKNDCIEKLKQL